MKKKRYCVTYDLTIGYDVTVKAKNASEALKKVKEVIPDMENEDVYEIRANVEKING